MASPFHELQTTVSFHGRLSGSPHICDVNIIQNLLSLIKMKTSQKKNETNIKEVITCICKTVILLERSYGADYIARLLLGYDRYGLRKEAHKELETFGIMEDFYSFQIVNIIRYMEDEGFLKIVDANFGNIDITEKGEKFLDEPEDVIIPNKKLQTPELDRLLYAELRQIRREYSESQEIMPYEVYTNYTMEKLVKFKPENVTELRGIPGFGDVRINKYGHAVLKAIKRVKEDGPNLLLKMKANRPSHQSVKDLFLSGKSLSEIATEREITVTTTINYLERLHKTGQINLCEWIEENVEPQALHKGSEYFKQVNDPRLEEAFNVLGLDYTTLRMCKLYVANMNSEKAVLALAS